MNIDFSSIRVPRQRPRPTDPIEIFRRSAVTDDSINDLWLAQGDALREWDGSRTFNDVAVALNTGAGKTLVGLLIAQSLVNETQRQVVYACSSIQLVEQTAEKATGYGLPVTTYYQREFSNELYAGAEAPCVTTYQALFNGKSRFATDDIAAVIFDDAHTAEHILREQFSLHILRSEMEETYQRIANLFSSYHKSTGLGTSYEEALSGESSRLFWVPPFEVRGNLTELRQILLDAKLGQSINTMFSWEHIRDHEELCCVMISSSAVTLTPPIVPVSTLACFEPNVRRVYLSATLRAPDAFARAFGRKPGLIISPSTPVGECERMILVPSVTESVEDDVYFGKDTIKNKKALILTPSYRRSNTWKDIANIPARQEVPQAVTRFREDAAPNKLILAARYDGIDLPGDTCRVLIIDDLPMGLSPLERFQWELLHMENSFRSTIASRIVQSFGRISRGMSDHGVVIITGRELVGWLQLPRNQSLLPEFLRKQIQLGLALSRQANSPEQLTGFADACLGRMQGWIDFYNDNMQEGFPTPNEAEPDLEKSSTVALAEAEFGEALWKRDFHSAALVLQESLDSGFALSQSTGAWLAFWLGFTLEMTGDNETAGEYYSRSYGNQSNLPRRIYLGVDGSTVTNVQIANVHEQMRIGHPRPSSVAIPKTMISDLDPLKGIGSVPQTEEALRCLGQYLGLKSIRPDKEFNTGPDVLWIAQDEYGICMELKTDKKDNSEYWKRDVSQLHDHIQWVKDNHQLSEIIPIFVGSILPVAQDANPSPDMKIVDLEQFDVLAKKLISALEEAANGTLPLELGDKLEKVMRDRGLLFHDILTSLKMNELQKSHP